MAGFDSGAFDPAAFDENAFEMEASGGSDGTPDAFSFVDRAGVALSATVTGQAVQITGIDIPVEFTATNGLLDVNYDGNFQASRIVESGDHIRPQNTSSGSYLTAVNTLIEGGGVSDTFTSTTRAEGAVGNRPLWRSRFGFGFGLG